MPLDPLFTSKVSLPQKRPRKISRKRLLNPDKVFRKERAKQRQAGNPCFAEGRPALTGFKPPRKVWDER